MRFDPLGIVLLSADPMRVHYAFGVAATMASLGRKVRFLASGDGVLTLKADLTALIPEALAEKWQRREIISLTELRETLIPTGVEVFACVSALHLQDLKAEDLYTAIRIVSLLSFFEEVGSGELMTV